MPTIGWSETAPSDASSAALGDDELRSLKTNIAGGLSTSMYWPGTGGGSTASAGQLKPGTARAFVGTQSQVSASADGQLMFTSDTTRLFAVNSATTPFLGGSAVVEQATTPATNASWVISSGNNSPNAVQILYGVTYTANPVIGVSLKTTTSMSTVGVAVINSYDSSGFTVDVYRMGSNVTYGENTWKVIWTSIGQVGF